VKEKRFLMSAHIDYSAPETRYLIPSRSERGDIRLSQYRVEGKVESSSYGVDLSQCIVEGAINAYRDVTLDHCFSQNICSTQYGVDVTAGSVVSGRIQAYKDVKLKHSAVEQGVESKQYGVSVQSGSSVAGGIKAYKDIAVSDSTVQGDVSSSQYGVKLDKEAEVHGDIKAYKDIAVSASTVHGTVCSSQYGIKLEKESKVGENLQAYKKIELDHSVVDGDVSSSQYGIRIQKDSRVKGKLEAYRDIQVEESFIGGDMRSSAYAVQIKDSDCQSKCVEAYKGIVITNSSLSEQLRVNSGSCGVSIVGRKEESDKIAKVMAGKDIDLKDLSCSEVRAPTGQVSCVNGAFDVVESSGSPSLKKAKIEKLELCFEEGKDVLVNLSDSEVKDVAIKIKRSAQSLTSQLGCYSYRSESADGITWLSGDSTLKASRNGFVVEGPMLPSFTAKIIKYCPVGTRGTVGAKSAVVVRGGVKISMDPMEGADVASSSSDEEEGGAQKVAGKISFIGGKILGSIHCEEAVHLDLAHTQVLGEVYIP
jgi:predicted acyltransferase (DUF342 family)